MYNETQGAELDIDRDNAEMDSPVFTSEPFMPSAESQNTRESQQPNSNYAAVMPETVSVCNNPLVNEETLFTIIQSIKNLESLLNVVKSSILSAVESKLQEMKSTLVSAIDNAKTYSEAVLKQPVIIDSSSADEGYFNNTTDTTENCISKYYIYSYFRVCETYTETHSCTCH